MESIKVEDLLALPLFQCKQCKMRLSKPIMNVPNLGNICGRCFIKDVHETAEEDNDISNILSKLLIPCSFTKNGCFFKGLFCKITTHEDICRHKERVCPFLYVNKCENTVISSVNEHIKAEHGRNVHCYDPKGIKLELSLGSEFEDFHLLILDEEDYLLRIKLDNAQNSLYFLIYYFECDAHNFFIENKNENFSVRDTSCNTAPELYLTSTFDYINATKFDLGMLKKCFNETMMTVIKTSTPTCRFTNSRLLKVMECSFCNEHMNSEIRQCNKGHSLCKACVLKFLVECPLCKSGLGKSRNYALESLCSFIYFPCKNNGCTKYIFGEEIEKHESECKFKRYNCPFLIKLNCQWKDVHKNIIDHLISEHSEYTVFQDYVQRQIKLDCVNNKYDTICMVLGKNIFKVCICVNSSNKLFLTYGLYGPPSVNCKFHWETGIYHRNSERHKFVVKDICSTYQAMNYRLNIESYTINNTIYFYHKIH